jgi:phage gp36-like protein
VGNTNYAQVSDLELRYTARDLIELTDPNATTLNPTLLQQALNDAAAEIDGYLESRLTLPLSDPPQILTLLCCTIAIYDMQTLRPLRDLEDARKRYDDAIRKLEKFAKGELTLGLTVGGVEPQSAQQTVSVQPSPVANVSPLQGNVFTRGSLSSY